MIYLKHLITGIYTFIITGVSRNRRERKSQSRILGAVQARTVVFTLEYVSREPKSDGYENNAVLLLSAKEAAERKDITNMSRVILRAYIADKTNVLNKSSYVPRSTTAGKYEIYGF